MDYHLEIKNLDPSTDYNANKRKDILKELMKKERFLRLKLEKLHAQLTRTRYRFKRMEEIKIREQSKLDFQIAQTKSLTLKYEHLKAQVYKQSLSQVDKCSLNVENACLLASKENVLNNQNCFADMKMQLKAIEDKILVHPPKRKW